MVVSMATCRINQVLNFLNFFRYENLVNEMPNECLLIMDSWTDHNDESIYSEVNLNMNLNKNIKRITIPPNATSSLQPCDTGFNYYLKYFSKYIFNFVVIQNIDINLKSRNNIITMWSLILNQFNSNKFTDLFKYVWYKPGLLISKASRYLSVNEILFKNFHTNCYECDKKNIHNLFLL